MGKSRNQIIEDIDNHLRCSGKRYYSEFYIGISSDARRRLFQEHHVKEKGSWWIYRTADSSDIARDVERHYLALGMRGGDGGGDESALMVYCYAVSPTTSE